LEYTLIIHELAAEDMIEIARWYDLQLPGLGNRFEKYLENCLEAIYKNPTAHNKATETTRKAYVKKFPFIIFFELEEDIIHIYGVIHSKRNPLLMKERFREIQKK
jgi:plasmid stabilization system protein ParE